MRFSLLTRIIAGGVVMALLLTPAIFSQVPPTITYQGRLLDNSGNPVPNNNYDISFRIVSTATGSDVVVWESGTQSIPVAGGVFTYELGSAVPMPDDIFAGDTTGTLGIKIGSDPEIAPRTKLNSVAFAFHSLRSDTAGYATSVADNSVSGDKIASASIAAPHIINGAVTSAKIQDNTILLNDIAQNGATIGQVISWNGSSWETVNSDGDISSITAGEGLSGGGSTGDVSLAIGYNSVTSAMIKDDEIATEDIAPDAIIGSRIAAGAVSNADLANDAVNSAKIQNASITAADLGASSVYSTEIADGTVGNVDLAVNAVTSAKILDGMVATADLAPHAVTSAKIANGTIVSADLASNVVGPDEIVDGAVRNAELAPDAITSNKIFDGTIVGADLAKSSVSSIHIVGGTITSSDLGTNSVTADEIATDAVRAAEIQAGAVGNSELASDAVTGAKVSNGSLYDSDIGDEPGVAHYATSSYYGQNISGPHKLITRTINCPTSGYVLAIGSAYCELNKFLSSIKYSIGMQVSDSSVYDIKSPRRTFSLPIDATQGYYDASLSQQLIYYVSAGNNTFYLHSYIWTPSTTYQYIHDYALSLLFVPTAYGTMTYPAPETDNPPLEDE